MSIATEIQRLQLAKEDIKSAIVEKGGTIEEGALIDTYGDAIRGIFDGIKFESMSYHVYDFTTYDKEELYFNSNKATAYATSLYYADENCAAASNAVTNKGILRNNTTVKKCVLLFPNAVHARYAFYFCANLEEVTIDTTSFCDLKDGAWIALMKTFEGCAKLKYIYGVLDFTKCTFNGTFDRCSALIFVDIMEGTIFKSVSFAYSAMLSDEGIQTIIDGLADLTGQTSQKLTLHADVKAKLTEEQIATITSKNWTLA